MSSNMGIFEACRKGDLAAVRSALCCGVDPNARSQGQTPLMFAAECGHASISQLLISNGAQVDALDTYNRTALHAAAKNNCLDAARVLVEAGAKNDIESTLGGETPCDIVKLKGSIEMVRLVVFGNKGDATNSSFSAAPAVEGPPQPSPAAAAAISAKPQVPSARAKEETYEAPPVVAPSVPRKPPAPEKDETRRLAPLPVSAAHA